MERSNTPGYAPIWNTNSLEETQEMLELLEKLKNSHPANLIRLGKVGIIFAMYYRWKYRIKKEDEYICMVTLVKS